MSAPPATGRPGAREAAVREAFRTQAGWCETLGSPLTSRLCAVLAERLGRDTALGRRLLDWPGEPDALHDSVPLRIAGGLHALVRRGRLPGLASLYPPHPPPSPDALWAGVAAALAEAEQDLAPWLDLPPQTNEVARSAVLMSGYLAVAAATGLPLALLELGASAGLNLLADRYRLRLGARDIGPSGSPVRLAPAWAGADLPDAEVRVVSRRGVDRNPLDPASAADRERLLAYVWPDQAERLARLDAALAIAAPDPPAVDRDDAGRWLAARLDEPAPDGVARVVAHSIAFQYFSPGTQARIVASLDRAGAAATRTSPLAWLRYESDPALGRASLRLKLWPPGDDRLLAVADAHGRSVEWRG